MIFFLHLLKSCSSIEIWQEWTDIFKKTSGWPFFRQCWAVFIHEFRTFSVKLGQEIFHSYPTHLRHACITGNTLQALSEGASWTGWEEAGTHDGDSLAVNALEKYLYQRARRLKERPISDLESGGRISHGASFGKHYKSSGLHCICENCLILLTLCKAPIALSLSSEGGLYYTS